MSIRIILFSRSVCNNIFLWYCPFYEPWGSRKNLPVIRTHIYPKKWSYQTDCSLQTTHLAIVKEQRLKEHHTRVRNDSKVSATKGRPVCVVRHSSRMSHLSIARYNTPSQDAFNMSQYSAWQNYSGILIVAIPSMNFPEPCSIREEMSWTTTYS